MIYLKYRIRGTSFRYCIRSTFMADKKNLILGFFVLVVFSQFEYY